MTRRPAKTHEFSAITPCFNRQIYLICTVFSTIPYISSKWYFLNWKLLIFSSKHSIHLKHHESKKSLFKRITDLNQVIYQPCKKQDTFEWPKSQLVYSNPPTLQPLEYECLLIIKPSFEWVVKFQVRLIKTLKGKLGLQVTTILWLRICLVEGLRKDDRVTPLTRDLSTFFESKLPTDTTTSLSFSFLSSQA